MCVIGMQSRLVEECLGRIGEMTTARLTAGAPDRQAIAGGNIEYLSVGEAKLMTNNADGLEFAAGEDKQGRFLEVPPGAYWTCWTVRLRGLGAAGEQAGVSVDQLGPSLQVATPVCPHVEGGTVGCEAGELVLVSGRSRLRLAKTMGVRQEPCTVANWDISLMRLPSREGEAGKPAQPATPAVLCPPP
jgi:hypothetical protein